jgi:hypothetical protein
MRVMLQARGLWAAVIEGGIEYTEDHMMLEVISKMVPPKMLGSIANKTLAKAAWDSIILHNIGVDRVRKTKTNSLKHKFDSISFHDRESVDDFGACIDQIANQLTIPGFEYQEEEIVHRFLLALPPKFEQIAASIETLLDLETITIDELIEFLKPSEERMNHGNGNTVANLNLMKDELVVRFSSCLKLSGSGCNDRSKEPSSSGNKRGRGHGRGRGSNSGGRGSGRGVGDTGERGGKSSARGSDGGSDDIACDKCHYYGKKGH